MLSPDTKRRKESRYSPETFLFPNKDVGQWTQSSINRMIRFLETLNKEYRSKDLKLNILFVGLSKEEAIIAKIAALKTNQFYIGPNWTPGLLTNWKHTTLRSISRYNASKKRLLVKLQAIDQNRLQSDTLLHREITEYFDLRDRWEGVSNLTKFPDLIVFLTPPKNSIPVNEAQRQLVPTACILEEKDHSTYKNHFSFCLLKKKKGLQETMFYMNILVNKLNQVLPLQTQS